MPNNQGGTPVAAHMPLTTGVCSATATALGPLYLTAPSRASASGAGSSRPGRSSSPFSNDSATTPKSAVKTSGPSSSTASSMESPTPSECGSMGASPGHADHLYNSGSEHVIELLEVSTIPSDYGWGTLLPHATPERPPVDTDAVPALRDNGLIKGPEATPYVPGSRGTQSARPPPEVGPTSGRTRSVGGSRSPWA
jgi:hypothetical protein